MRMRKKKNGEARLLQCERILYRHGGEPMDSPSLSVFGKELPVYLEIGAGKGGFARGMVKKNPAVAYFAMERVSDCVVLAAEAALAEEGFENLRFIVDNADNLPSIFAPESVDKLFLNFSDPWPKKGYAKRRLTHRRYLAIYLSLMKDGATLTFKTDNVGLFDFTLGEIEAMGIAPVKLTRDLHTSEYSENNVVTEYEKNFSEAGVKINMVEIVKPYGYEAPEFSKAESVGKNENY